MPSVSAAQHNLMAAAMHNPSFAAKHHIKPSVAAEFVHADKGRTFHAGGGDVVVRALHHAHDMAREKRDAGGYTPPNMPFSARQDVRGETASLPSGLIHSSVAGRTDQLPMSPAAGSYVIPADVVSGVGEGNTLAGAAVLDKYLHSQPWGVQPAQHHGGNTIPHPPAAYRANSGFKAGGKVGRSGNVIHYAFGGPQAVHAQPGVDPHEGKPGTVPIIAAGGEYIVPPSAVAYHPGLGMGDPNNPDPKHRQAALKRGHAILDQFVKTRRHGVIKELKKLPGPAK